MVCLVTRPQPHSERLSTLLQAKGVTAQAAPMVEIHPSQQMPQLAELAQEQSLAAQTLIVAVSQYAVEACQQFLNESGLSWPASTRYLAVGQATAECWAQYGVTAMVPEQQDSEGMLQLISAIALPKRALILRGQQGREWLAERLREQQVQVDYQCSYRRHYLSYSSEQVEKWRHSVDCIIATSGEIIKHLTTLITTTEQATWLASCKLVVPSQRLVNYAQQLGFSDLVLSVGASDQACLQAIAGLHPSTRNDND